MLFSVLLNQDTIFIPYMRLQDKDQDQNQNLAYNIKPKTKTLHIRLRPKLRLADGLQHQD